MSDSLWPENIRPRILSPMAILRAQAAALLKQTNGIMSAEVTYKEEDEGRITLHFDFIVPALDDYRHRIMNIAYKKDLPYPAVVNAEIFRGSKAYETFLERGSILSYEKNIASNDIELKRLIAYVFSSTQVLSVAQSLIARATDALEDKEQQDDAPSVPKPEPPDSPVSGG